MHHLHGSLAVPKCFACHRYASVSDEQCLVPQGALIEPPRCTKCNGKMRPAVVWYGEDLNAATWKAAETLVKNCDVLISVGTSGIVTPAASLPSLALTNRATGIHVNLQDVSQGSEKEIMLTGKATDILSILVDLVNYQGDRSSSDARSYAVLLATLMISPIQYGHNDQHRKPLHMRRPLEPWACWRGPHQPSDRRSRSVDSDRRRITIPNEPRSRTTDDLSLRC